MIYIVEDDAAIRELEQYALQSSGYEVTSFESSEPFWQAMHAAEPELVILDVMLPGEDGFSHPEKAAQHPFLRRLPIIMVTAKSSELDTVRGLDCGADDYISKLLDHGIFEPGARRLAPLGSGSTSQRTQLSRDPAGQCPSQRDCERNAGGADLQGVQPAAFAAGEHQSGGDTRDHSAGGVGHRHFGGEPHCGYAYPHLRKKLGDAGKYICTVRKVGYKLTDEEEAGEE